MRWRTLSILKSSRRTPFSSSFHVDGRRHRCAWLGAHGIDARQRLPPRVLLVVNDDASLGSRGDPIADGHELRVSRGQLGRQRLRKGMDDVLKRAAFQRDVHVEPTRACGLHIRLHAERRQRIAHDQPALACLFECRALTWVEIEMQIVRPVYIVAAGVPLIEIDAPEVDQPQQRRRGRRSRGSSRLCRHRDRSRRCGSTEDEARAPLS